MITGFKIVEEKYLSRDQAADQRAVTVSDNIKRLICDISETMLTFEHLMTSLQGCVISEDQASERVSQTLGRFIDKLSESSRLVSNLNFTILIIVYKHCICLVFNTVLIIMLGWTGVVSKDARSAV